VRIAGLITAILAVTAIAAASLFNSKIEPLVPALQSNWLLAHVLMSFIAYALFAVSFSTGLMYLMVRTEDRREPAYVFWTLMLGIFIVVLAAMGLDYLQFKMFVSKPEELIQGFLFKATFRSDSAFISVLSWAVSLGVIAVVWYFGAALKKIIAGFSISADILDDLTYKSIAIEIGRAHV